MCAGKEQRNGRIAHFVSPNHSMMCDSLDMNYARISAELLRALRGKRSQIATCRRLGFKSNAVHQWERARSAPRASRALWAARQLGVDVQRAYREFYGTPPSWLERIDPASPQGVAAFLNDLRGNTSIVELARYTGKSRFAIARWLTQKSEPRLPDFLMMIECCSLRLLDFLEQLVDPRLIPSVRGPWQKLQVARRLAYDEPWSQAVLRALELESYRQLEKHRDGWIAERIGVSEGVETRSLRRLLDSGQIALDEGRYRVNNIMTVDTRRDPERAARLRGWWVRQGAKRSEQGARGTMYNIFGVSGADLARLRELQKAYLGELRAIVARSEPVEHVVLAADLLLDLGEDEGGAVSGAN